MRTSGFFNQRNQPRNPRWIIQVSVAGILMVSGCGHEIRRVITSYSIHYTKLYDDVILNNSVSEGLPNALLEATALGLPILARNIPGNAAVVESGGNGLLYDDAAGFLESAVRLLNDPDLRRSLSHPQPERYAPA